MKWFTTRVSEAVSFITIHCDRTKNWEQWVLITADRHLDNPKSKRKLQRRHLDQMMERDGICIDIGDNFCAMQGKYDPRRTRKDVLPELNVDDYTDALVDYHQEFYKPYAQHIAYMCRGNHELSILRHLEVDLTGRLCKRLRQYNNHIIDAGYRGWIKFRFEDMKGKGKTETQSINFYTTHGGNSNAVVTKGILQAGRRGVVYPDADVVLQGNIHESWIWEIPRSRLSRNGKERVDIQTHICIPTYKDEFFGDASGYHHLNERPPKPIGAWWCRFYWDSDDRRVKYSFMRAR